MTWKQACKKSPHRMAIHTGTLQGVPYWLVCTQHEDLFMRGGSIEGEAEFVPFGCLKEKVRIGRFQFWKPLLDKVPGGKVKP